MTLLGCDLVRIKIDVVVAGADVRNRAIVIQQKTNRPVQFELTADVRATLIAWLDWRGEKPAGRAHFGGTFAPFLQLALDGERAWLA